jgi:hypothetical protein
METSLKVAKQRRGSMVARIYSMAGMFDDADWLQHQDGADVCEEALEEREGKTEPLSATSEDEA